MSSFKQMIRLDKNENPFSIPDFIQKEIFSALVHTEINRYPDASYGEIKESLRILTGFSPKNYILGNGGDEVLWLLFAAYAGPNATILSFSPSFSEYAHLCKVFHARHVTVPIDMGDKDCSFDTGLFLEKVKRERPALVLIDSPNNPTGKNLPQQFLREVIENNEGITVIDEAYGEFAQKTFLQSLQTKEMPPNTVILKTLSKAWGLAGIRFGYGICDPTVAHALNTIKSPFNVNQLTAAIVQIVLKYPQLFENRKMELIKIRDSFIDQCSRFPWLKIYPSEANFVLLHIPEEKKFLQRFFEENNVAVKFFKISHEDDSWIRVSIGLSSEMEKVLDCLSRLSKRFE
jgi:histidinol-phosphate aminotransferase